MEKTIQQMMIDRIQQLKREASKTGLKNLIVRYHGVSFKDLRGISSELLIRAIIQTEYGFDRSYGMAV